jgi:hypothetical protein
MERCIFTAKGARLGNIRRKVDKENDIVTGFVITILGLAGIVLIIWTASIIFWHWAIRLFGG